MHHVTGLAHFLPPQCFQESIFTAAHSLAWPYTQLQGNSPALQTFLSWVMGFEVTQSRAKTRDDENVLMGLFQTSEMWWCIMLNAIGDIVLLFYFVLQGEKRKLLLYREIYKGASCNHVYVCCGKQHVKLWKCCLYPSLCGQMHPLLPDLSLLSHFSWETAEGCLFFPPLFAVVYPLGNILRLPYISGTDNTWQNLIQFFFLFNVKACRQML